MQWYNYTKTQLTQELKADLEIGLSAKEAQRRLLAHGPNLLPEKPPESWLVIFFRQFKSPLIYILLVCAAIIYVIGEDMDSIIILAVLFFNALIGAIQEGRTENTLRSLKKLSEAEATVVRQGVEEVILESEVVPGDVLVLQEGQKVTADARLVAVFNLSVDEAAMTGESGGVLKNDASLPESNLPASAQHNMVFKGTCVLSGSARAVVVGTGLNTEIGKISKALLEPQTEIPLQINIRKLSQVIIYAIGIISLALFVLGVLSGKDTKEMFMVVVSLAVSMIPEGLPLVLTLILVTGVWRMSKRNALVKKLQAVEALGQADVIAVDKTGTITKNEMTVKQVFIGNKIYTVSGSGYEPKGQVSLKELPQTHNSDVLMAARIAALVNRAAVVYSETEGRYKIAGDPTEAAMSVFAEKMRQTKEQLHSGHAELAEIPFDHKTKYHAIFYEHKDEVFCAIAGAPETLLKKAAHFLENGQSRQLTPKQTEIFEEAVEEFSGHGFRVVAFGYKRLAKSHPFDNVDELVFAGLFGIEDSVRSEVIESVKQAHKAGVKVVMITGDHRTTAKAIAREAGIYSEGDRIITGTELQEMTHQELAGKLMTTSVFARVTPEDKMKIIKAYKHSGLIIAMTGDGVNDAPSLVAADLGVAMGKIGTEVAKDAADIVLLDDNLSSIVAAIEEGRAMYKNIQKSLLFLFSTSLGELLAIVLALALGLPLPVLAAQILWLNLVTDPLIGMALALDAKEPGLLERKHTKLPRYFITFPMLVQMGLIGIVMAAGSVYLFSLYYQVDYVRALTISLTTLAVYQWYNGFNCQFPSVSIFSRQIFRNPYLWLAIAANFGLQFLAVYNPGMQKVLRTVPLTWGEWAMILGVSFSVILAEESRKLLYKLFKGKKIAQIRPIANQAVNQ